MKGLKCKHIYDRDVEAWKPRTYVKCIKCGKIFRDFENYVVLLTRNMNVIIPHGCKPERCASKEESRRFFGIPEQAKIVGYCGFISQYKGLEYLIEAMTKIKDSALLIAGGWFTQKDTEYINSLKLKTLELLPGRCQWLGYVKDEDLKYAYGAMDVLVYPSIFSTESGALLRALSYGKAVIASNLPPFREKKDALMIFDDVDDLVEKIKLLLNNEGMRRILEDNAFNYAHENTWDLVSKKHISLYEEVISEYEQRKDSD